jgi:hypothetical protein
MQGSTYPEGALPAPVSRTPIVAAIVALVVGGAIATGIWWLTDNDVDVLSEPATKVIVAEPGVPSEGVMAKDEARTAAMISGSAITVNPSTGFASDQTFGTSQYRSGVNEGTADGPRYIHEPGQRYDGGPEEGTAVGSIAGASDRP